MIKHQGDSYNTDRSFYKLPHGALYDETAKPYAKSAYGSYTITQNTPGYAGGGLVGWAGGSDLITVVVVEVIMMRWFSLMGRS